MRFARFWNRRRDKSRAQRQQRASRRRLTTALSLEYLEDRRLLTTITPSLPTDGNTFTLQNPTSAFASISVPTLRDAVIEANWLFNNAASHTQGDPNTIRLTLGLYTLTLQNTAGYENASQTGDLNINSDLTITGVGLPTIQQKATDRVFAINTSGETVNFNNLIITGGTAVNDTTPGAQPGTATATLGAEGGGIWAAANTTLSLSNVTFRGDEALGAAANAATTYYPTGQDAIGGAIFDISGTLGLTNVTFLSNSAIGGAGANGTFSAENGGYGGSALGGAMFTENVAVTLGGASPVSTVTFNGNQAVSGAGGNGYSTTTASPVAKGGDGGDAAGAIGGAVLSEGGSFVEATGSSVILNLANFTGNKALGGKGGNGGNGTQTGGNAGSTYNGGGTAEGGGLIASGATVTLRGGSVISNLAQGGNGGTGGNGPIKGGNGGYGGFGIIGGVLIGSSSPSSLTQVSILSNTAQGGTGGAGGAGTGSSGVGGQGGGGGHTGASALYTYSTLALTSDVISGNLTQGGNGGAGGAGGAAGTGGLGGSGGNVIFGGAIFEEGATLTINLGSITVNRAYGGNGGSGGSAGTGNQGGPGGTVQGGAIYGDGGTLNLYGAIVSANLSQGANLAQGGNGGNGGKSSAPSALGGAGGNGGFAQGGALYLYDDITAEITTYATVAGKTTINTPSYVLGNRIVGGNGGSGGAGSTLALVGYAGNGGQADGAGLYVGGFSGDTSVVTVNGAYIDSNSGQGGNGGVSGARNTTLGVAGSAFGGGAYLAYGTLTLDDTWVMSNIVLAGLGYLGATPAATNSGGGVYVLPTYTAFTDPGSTISNNLPNQIVYAT